MRLLLVRHGESQGNVEFRLQGRREFPLTPRGIAQAQALGERLAVLRPSAVYSSPIRRALDTAAIIAGACRLEPIPDERFQEYDFGEALSGLTWQEIRERAPDVLAALAGDGPDFPRYPGEEGRAAFKARVGRALADILQRHDDGESVVVVTHAGPIVALVMTATGREYARPIPFNIDNASLTTLEYNGTGAGAPHPVVVGLNDTCHLRCAVPQPPSERSDQ